MEQNIDKSTVQVSVDQLQTLLKSITDLKNEMKVLGKESAETMDFIQKSVANMNSLQRDMKRLNETARSVKASSVSSLEDIATFPNFAKLPAELRLKIWKIELRRPRVIAVQFTISPVTDYEDWITPVSPTSALLKVNKESRSAALKVLTSYDKSIPQSGPILYFNRKVDTLWMINYQPKFNCSQIGLDTWKDHFKLRKVAWSFQKLEEIVQNFNQDLDYADSLMQFCFLRDIREVTIIMETPFNEASSTSRFLNALKEGSVLPFMKPRQRFATMVPQTSLITNLRCQYLDVSWDDLNDDLKTRFETYAQEACDTYNIWEYKDEQLVTSDPLELLGVSWYFEEWIIPKFRFVEVATGTTLRM